MAKYIPTDKFNNLMTAIKQNGGFMNSLKKMWINDELKDGRCVGEDKYGNKYYENPRFMFPRDRWVEYAPNTYFEYDASMIPAEWYGWMHHKTDLKPHEDCARPQYKWMQPHTENLTGTTRQYYPYSTTIPKIEPWKPAAPKPKSC